MECMATSDNVVRAGLTPKLRDVPTLTSMLTYKWGPADSQIMPPVKYRSTKATTIYDPPIEEFSVLMTCLKSGENEVHEPIKGPSILILTEGSGRLAWTEKDSSRQEESLEKPGLVYFAGAGVGLELEAGEGGMTVYRAITELQNTLTCAKNELGATSPTGGSMPTAVLESNRRWQRNSDDIHRSRKRRPA
ncbi:Mannose-6-phosphate isomerase [Tulasnella sp. 427]|nr:Mannose-6-phosphate isomerase [Tulasnella sp. 427]